MKAKQIRLLLLATLTSLVVLAVPSGATAGGMQNCGGGVRAVKVPCSKAKRIATEYAKTHAHALQGYTCSGGGSQGRCVLDRKVVTFRL